MEYKIGKFIGTCCCSMYQLATQLLYAFELNIIDHLSFLSSFSLLLNLLYMYKMTVSQLNCIKAISMNLVINICFQTIECTISWRKFEFLRRFYTFHRNTWAAKIPLNSPNFQQISGSPWWWSKCKHLINVIWMNNKNILMLFYSISCGFKFREDLNYPQ